MAFRLCARLLLSSCDGVQQRTRLPAPGDGELVAGAGRRHVQERALPQHRIGVVGLGVVESTEDDELRRKRQEGSNYKYAKSWLALCLPLAYCLLDAAGTFADSLVLRTLDEDSANCAYELTFLAAAVICFIYVVVIKKDKLVFKAEAPKYAGALFETAGQFAYIYALADEAHVALSAPIISAYCAASVLWSRIFLKEKLSWKHYVMIALVVIGIVMIGIFDI